MSLSQDHSNLFRRSDVTDKLSLLQSLLDSRDLTPVQAIALLNNIRAELETPQTNRSSVYRRYAQVMESLRRAMPEVHEEVVQAWETKKATLQTQGEAEENEEVEVEEVVSELGEEIEIESEEPSKDAVMETETEEELEGGDRMATEEAEAAEHMESESEQDEVPGEEGPPMEAGE